jgi:glycosyltransferase involved in cell wall biosynthesis
MRDTVREEAIYAQANAITVASSFVARSFVEMGVPAGKVHVIPYGVRLAGVGALGEPPAGEFNVLFAGGAGLRKGVPYLLQAFANLRHPTKTLRVAGYVRPDLRDVLHRLPQENVEFLGPVGGERLAELMSGSDVLVLPSIEDGFGMVMAEAMARGCPVISSTNTGGSDLYTDGVEGFIVPIRDPQSITERMQWMADNPLKAGEMRAAALRKVESLGGWGDYGDGWERLLRELTA